MRAWFVVLLILNSSAACGGESTDSVGGDAVDVKDGDDELPVSITEGDVETPSELCSRVWGRLVACGHFYTFPTFEQVCADFTPAETETLRTCSVRPCAGLFTCVRDELHVPVGGN